MSVELKAKKTQIPQYLLIMIDYLMALGPPDRQGNRELAIPANLGYFRPQSGIMFELPCNVSDSALTQAITWTKNGIVLPRQQNKRALLFPSVSETDGGYYTCTAGLEEYNALVDVKPKSVQGISIFQYKIYTDICT